jgi:hypothetical protein
MSNDKKQVLDEIFKAISQRRAKPEDVYEIAAVLEAMGWNNRKVQETFGYEDIFNLASKLWEIFESRDYRSNTIYDSVSKEKIRDKIYILITSFLRGVIFALPMAISVFAMLFLRFSLWSYYDLSVELATSIAIGTILSFMVIGGFTQAIARRGFYYVIQGYYKMAKRMTFYFVKVGYVICTIISILFFLFNLFVRMISIQMSIIIILYFFFLSTIWLSVTVMYILKKELLFTGLLVAGIGFVFLFKNIFGLYIVTAQIISLFIVTVLGIFLVIYYFNIAEDEMEVGIKPLLPKMSIIIYTIAPYFYYGFLYFTFLFVDRVMAWSTNDSYMPYLIWFKGAYELGLDFSLIILIIPIGVCEVIITRLMTELETTQKNYLHHESQSLNKKYLKLYVTRLIIIAITAILSGIILYLIVYYVNGKEIYLFGNMLETDLMSSAITREVFLISLIAYGILSLGLLNAVILFSFSQPTLVIWAIIKALFVNALSGFLLSRLFEHYFAVYGLLLGCILFFVLSTYKVYYLLKDLDYFIYAQS